MPLWRQFSRGVRVLVRRQAADREVDDEARHYFEEAAAAFAAKGLSPEEARRAARMEIGNLFDLRHQCASTAGRMR